MSRSATVSFLLQLLKESFSLLSKKQKIRFFIGCFILVLGCLLSAVVQVIFRHLVDDVIISENNIIFTSFAFLIALYSICWTINQISNIASWLINEPVLAEVSQYIILKMYAHTVQVPYDFFLTKDARSLNIYFETVFQACSSILSNLIIHIIPSLLEMTIIFIFFIHIYPIWYGLFLLLLLLVFFYFTYVSIKESKHLDAAYYGYLEKFQSLLLESINQIMMIKTYCTYEFETERIKKILNSFFIVAKKRIWQLDQAQGAQIVACGITLLLLSFLSGLAVMHNKISTGDFVMINNYFIQFTIPITFLGYIFADVYRHFILLKKSIFIFKLPTESQEKRIIDIVDFIPHIIFDAVDFTINKKKILKSVSFEIKPGEKVAIVGISGSGKSTCLKLIMQLYEPDSGIIFMSGVMSSSISRKTISDNIGIVLQESYLFQGSIADNIRYGKKNISDQKIIDVLKKVKLYEKVKSLSHFIDTDTATLDFSGGEKQRIAIARALLREPKLFLFDEITASLDTKTEHEIQEYLHEILENKTAIFITHRLSFAKEATKIIVMKKGSIASIGTHFDLIKRCPEYQLLNEECTF